MEDIIKTISPLDEKSKTFIDHRLIIQVRIFLIIFCALILLILYDVFIGNVIRPPVALGGLSGGILAGLFAANIFPLKWHAKSRKVVLALDRVSIALIFLYVVFLICRQWIFGHWFHGAQLTAFIFCFIAGTTLVRFLMMHINIKTILRSKGKIK